MVWFEIGRGRRDRGAQKAKKAHLSVSLFLIRAPGVEIRTKYMFYMILSYSTCFAISIITFIDALSGSDFEKF